MSARNLILSVVLLCAVTTVAQGQKEKKARHDPRRITAEEIATKEGAQTALDLVQALRPSWLSSRGPTTILMQETGISVYVDGVKKYEKTSTNTISTSLSMSAGAHRVTVQAQDSSGYFRSTVNITVH